jgi:hypothetical protein
VAGGYKAIGLGPRLTIKRLDAYSIMIGMRAVVFLFSVL